MIAEISSPTTYPTIKWSDNLNIFLETPCQHEQQQLTVE